MVDELFCCVGFVRPYIVHDKIVCGFGQHFLWYAKFYSGFVRLRSCCGTLEHEVCDDIFFGRVIGVITGHVRTEAHPDVV